jgi:hypothetical protein
MTGGTGSGAVALQVGARFGFDGELVEVMQLEGARITVRDGRGRWRTLSLAVFLSRAVVAGDQPAVPALGTAMAALSATQRDALGERARHVREVLTGYRSGSPEAAAEGEPRLEYAPAGRWVPGRWPRPTSWACRSARCAAGCRRMSATVRPGCSTSGK